MALLVLRSLDFCSLYMYTDLAQASHLPWQKQFRDYAGYEIGHLKLVTHTSEMLIRFWSIQTFPVEFMFTCIFHALSAFALKAKAADMQDSDTVDWIIT